VTTEESGVASAKQFGVYIHIPFCRHRCDYCAFATWTDRDGLIVDYLAALLADISRTPMPTATSVFVGGGTPTRVPADLLAEVIAAVPRTGEAEITVECNPDDVTASMMRAYRAAGVNRISLGVQSMVPEVLVSLGRTHQPSNVERAVAAVREAGITTFNLDLIYGGAGESVADWRRTLQAAIGLRPTHVSAYALTVEPGTPLASDSARHPDDDDLADKYEITDDLLVGAGLDNYEVSNWALPGHECHHNMLYWQQGDYLGFGSAAHSHRGGRRWWNVRTPERIIAAVGAGEPTEAAHEQLDSETQRMEGLQLALRTRRGVPIEAIAADDLAELDGLITASGGRITLTRHGRLLANEVSMRLR
jgi:putative oxygen-independent coproporphyrinogen III oxidase